MSTITAGIDGTISGTKTGRSLVVDFSGANPVIYATTAETTTGTPAVPVSNRLVKIIDTGAASTATLLATSPANTSFRGVALAPFHHRHLILDIVPAAPATVDHSTTAASCRSCYVTPHRRHHRHRRCELGGHRQRR